MGGRGASRLAMKHPRLFCSLHNQAGNVLNLAMMGGQHDGDGRGIAPGWDAEHWARDPPPRTQGPAPFSGV